jgi:thioredoxin-like negative regulator of GroEL
MRTLLAAVLAALLAGCGEQQAARPDDGAPAAAPAAGRVLDVDDRSYRRVVQQAQGPVLVLFWAPWSGPDKIVLPYLEDAARERPGLTVVKVNVDESPETASRHEVMAVPTAIVLEGGKPRGDAVSGAAPQADWERRLGLDSVAPRV